MKKEADGVRYSTHDLNVAGFLIARGFPMLDMTPDGSFRKVFHFSAEAGELAPEFYRDAPVPARSFANAIRDLKARVLAT